MYRHATHLLLTYVKKRSFISDSAQCFLRNAQIGGDIPEGNALNDMGRMSNQAFIARLSLFEMVADKPILQHHVIVFIHESPQSLDIRMFVVEFLKIIV